MNFRTLHGMVQRCNCFDVVWAIFYDLYENSGVFCTMCGFWFNLEFLWL